MTRNAAQDALDLMPSPTQTSMPPRANRRKSVAFATDTLDLMPSPTITAAAPTPALAVQEPPPPLHIFSEAPFVDENSHPSAPASCGGGGDGGGSSKQRGLRAHASPVSASPAPAQGSPKFFTSVVEDVTMMTKKAQGVAIDLLPSPTRTNCFACESAPSMATGSASGEGACPGLGLGGADAVSPTVNTKRAERDAFDLLPSPTATVCCLCDSRAAACRSVYICMYVCMYVYAYIHTHTHTRNTCTHVPIYVEM